MKYEEDTLWNATIQCDKNFDGKFFYAVKTVGVYCRPSCKSRTPLRKNTLFFPTSEEAEKNGFRACKRCRPDIKNYTPTRDLVKKAEALLRNNALSTEEIKKLGVSQNHLSFLFKKYYGLSPKEYKDKIRILKAQKLLSETTMSITEITYHIGFNSPSAFYSFFRKHLQITPKQYRHFSKRNEVTS